MAIYFYGDARVRSKIRVDLDENTALIVFSTQKHPQGTRVDDPDEGVFGSNTCQHSPATPVSLYRAVGGTGQNDSADPLSLWDLSQIEQAEKAGLVELICNGYLTREVSVRKGDSEGGESLERRFEVEITFDARVPFNRGLPELAAHAALLPLVVISTQAELDLGDDRPAKRTKRTKQVGLFDAPDVTAAVPVVLPDAPAEEPPFQMVETGEETLPEWIERSIRKSDLPRVPIAQLAAATGFAEDEIRGFIVGNPTLLGINPNGTVFAQADLRVADTKKLLADLEQGNGSPFHLAQVQAELDRRPVELPPEPESMIERATKARRKGKAAVE